LQLDINSDGSYTYNITDGDLSVLGIDGLTLSAQGVQISGDNSNTGIITVNLQDGEFVLGNTLGLGGDNINFTYDQDTKALAFSGSSLFAFAGYGLETSDITDDVGLTLSDVTLALNINNTDGTYNYNLSNASLGIRGISGVTIEAENITATGNNNDITITSGDYALGLSSIVWLEGNGLSFSSLDNNGNRTVTFDLNNASILAGYGADTTTTADDLGININNANVDITLNNNGTYEYDLSSANAGLIGIDGITLNVGSLNATGNQNAINLTLNNAEIGVKNLLDLTANSINLNIVETAAGADISFNGVGIGGFIGYDNNIGLSLSNANLLLDINEDKSYNYNLNNADVSIIGIPSLNLSADNVSLVGDNTGNSLEVSLNNAILGVDNLLKVTGDSIIFQSQITDNGKNINFNGTNLSIFAGYGIETAETSDDIGLNITNADFNFALNGDGSYNYGLNNANVAVVGIPTLTLNAENISATGDENNTNINLSNAVFGLGNLFSVSGSNIEFNLEKTATGNNITFGGIGLNAFIGYGADTVTETDDIGFALSNADLNLNLNADNTYSYSLAKADIAVRGIPNITLDANNINVIGDNTGNISIDLAQFNIALANILGLSGDSLNINVQEGQPITIIGANIGALIGYGANTATPSDDIGLTVNNGNINIAINNDNTYSYNFNSAKAGIVGIEAITLTAEDIQVSGNQTGVENVTTGIFEIGIQDVGYISGAGLVYLPTEEAGEFSKIGAKNITAFIGTGGKTAQEAGIKLSNGELGLVFNNNPSNNYAIIASGEAEALNIPELTLEGSLALRINDIGTTINESITFSDNSTLEVIFGVGQENQLRVEGTVIAEIAGAVAFGGAFSMELFNEKTPGLVDLISNITDSALNLAYQEANISESQYQELLTLLQTEKANLEGGNNTIDGISATVDGYSFEEDFVNITTEEINFQSNHNFKEGQKVLYTVGGGNTAIGGLTDGDEYYVKVIDSDTIQLTDINGNIIDLTSIGTGNHQLREILDFTAQNNLRIDTNNETINFSNNHGLSDGSRVRYNANGNPVIGGLTNGKDYLVEVIDSNTIQLKDLDSGEIINLTSDSIGNHNLSPISYTLVPDAPFGGIDLVNDIIRFSAPHNLQTGDEIQYYRPSGGQPIKGTLDTLLTRQDVFPYLVVRISDTEIN
jgi:hypothetical protein